MVKAIPSTLALALAAPVNDPPVAGNQAYTTLEDTPLTVDVASGLLRGATDVDGDALRVVSTSKPINGILTWQPDGSLVYVPYKDFSGSDGFTYVISDPSGATSLGVVSITTSELRNSLGGRVVHPGGARRNVAPGPRAGMAWHGTWFSL